MGKRRLKPYAERAKLATTIPRLLRLLRIERWDYLAVGDGSATTWARECGWASLLVENRTYQRQLYYGGFSGGTNIVGEMMAPLQPLLHLAARKDRQKSPDGATYVHVVTDCEYVKKAGNREYGRGSNQMLWAMFDAARRDGILSQFHWVPRDSVPMQHATHHAANQARELMKQMVAEEFEPEVSAVRGEK